MPADNLEDYEYTCEGCGRRFMSDRSHDEALSEGEQVWGELGEDPVLICDDCFRVLNRILAIEEGEN